jgi:hypothetical protein
MDLLDDKKGYVTEQYLPIWSKYSNTLVYSHKGRQGATGYTLKKAYQKYLKGELTTIPYSDLKNVKTSKIKLKYLTIEFAEGSLSTYDEFPKNYSTWEEANNAVIPVYENAIKDGPDNYNKLGFRALFEDGEDYIGRLYVHEKGDNPLEGNVFGKHIDEFLKEDLASERTSDQSKKEINHFLNSYDLGFGQKEDIKNEAKIEELSSCLQRNGINLEKDHHNFSQGKIVRDLLNNTYYLVHEVSDLVTLTERSAFFGRVSEPNITVTYNELIEKFKAGQIWVEGFEKDEVMEFARVLNAIVSCNEKERLRKENEEIKSIAVISPEIQEANEEEEQEEEDVFGDPVISMKI